jgi:hypothetical protein
MRYVEPIDLNQLPSLAEIEASLKPAIRAVIGNDVASIGDAYAAFDTATPEELHALNPMGLSAEIRKSLEAVFSRRLGQFGTTWDALNQHLLDAGEGTCPYCNFGEQWEHDHYLPKSVFPEFTLYSRNLVPICKVCNGMKRALYQEDGERLFMHAFSELNGVDGLLGVTISYTPKPAISYSLIDPGDLPCFAVLERHFLKLDLGRRYSRQASTTLGHMVRLFRTPLSLGLGQHQLRRRLRQMAVDAAAQHPTNHWKVELLRCLARTQDFTAYVFS